MKIDMHCHVKEGSIDSKVGLEEYITILKQHGFQGMVITDQRTLWCSKELNMIQEMRDISS